MNAVTPLTRALTAANQHTRNSEIDAFAGDLTQCEQVRMIVALIQGGAGIEQCDDLVNALGPLNDVLNEHYDDIADAAVFGDMAKPRDRRDPTKVSYLKKRVS